MFLFLFNYCRPSVSLLSRVGIPVYFAHLIHARAIQEKQSILTKLYSIYSQ